MVEKGYEKKKQTKDRYDKDPRSKLYDENG